MMKVCCLAGIVFYPTKGQTTPDLSPHRPKVYYTDTDKLQAFMITKVDIATDTLDNAEMLFTLVDDLITKTIPSLPPRFDKGHVHGGQISLMSINKEIIVISHV